METGLDRLLSEAPLSRLLRGTKVGVLAHPASVTRDLAHAGDVFEVLGVRPKVFFGPEHGFGGEAQDMVGVQHGKTRHGIPIRSLYGDSLLELVPQAEDLSDVDLLVVDLQDVGSRYYTFVWTAVLAMRAAVDAKKRVLVLDRPNPIGGDLSQAEGRSQLMAYRSFVGLEPIAVRHGLTLGEIVAAEAEKHGASPEQVQVVAVRGDAGRVGAGAWDRPFVMPSPNMPTRETALVYPGGCLLEGTNLSEGRGTTRPFQVFGAPFIDGAALANAFHALDLPGVRVRPLTFRPTFHKFAGETCGGVEVYPIDERRFLPVATYVALIALCAEQAPERFAFRTERYEFVDDIPAFDLLTGDGQARAMILEGARPLDVAKSVSELRGGDAAALRRAREGFSRYAIS